jgi:enoyl-CoA hydratase/carnithine racemase
LKLVVKTKDGEFFRKEYKLDYLISELKVPHVAICDGYMFILIISIVMGGGVGVSVLLF